MHFVINFFAAIGLVAVLANLAHYLFGWRPRNKMKRLSDDQVRLGLVNVSPELVAREIAVFGREQTVEERLKIWRGRHP